MRLPRTLLALTLCAIPACTSTTKPTSSSDAFLYHDDFTHGLSDWSPELESGGTVSAHNGTLSIDVPAGCTLWFKHPLTSPVVIEYDATVLSRGGPNDRVSDLNCFWMARDSRSPDDLFATHRTGKFVDYNPLLTYYVGVGGNTNTTTRFRRYIGDQTTRPLLPEHDLRDPANLLQPNTPTHITLIADGPHIEFRRDGHPAFTFTDPAPYTSGYFAFRTTHSHLLIHNFVIHRPVR